MNFAIRLATLAFAAGSVFVTQADSASPSPVRRVGVVNWDCSVPSTTFFGKATTYTLGPKKWRDRTPYYAHVLGDDRIEHHYRSLEEYEVEMQYAIDAGIDYFAYCWYDLTPPPGDNTPCAGKLQEITRARLQHVESRLRDKLSLCAILVTSHPYSDECLRLLAKEMRNPWYEKVDGRPLVYMFSGTRDVAPRLRAICREHGLADPYLVPTISNSDPASCPEKYVGADAIGAYGSAEDGPLGEDYVNMTVLWNSVRASAGLPVIPLFSTGWNPTPRLERPNPWATYPAKPYVAKMTRENWLDEAVKLRRWIERNPDSCPTGHVLAFAWNEFEEGGWICPNIGEDGRPDTTRVLDFRQVVSELKSPGTSKPTALNRHGYFTDKALDAADIEGLGREIALAFGRCDKALEGAAKTSSMLSGHEKIAIERRMEMVKRLKRYIAARACAPERDELILAWQGAKELESFFDYFRFERERHEENARLPAPKVFDVRDFGARGDGTGDDGPAFAAAVEAARACGGAPTVVNIPEGTYRIAPDLHYPMKDFTCRDMQTAVSRGAVHPYSGERIDAHLVLKDLDNLTMRGAGMGKTILIFTDSSRGAIRACGCRQVFFEDFSVDLETNPSTQGTVEKVEAEPFALVVRIDEGFPFPDSPLYMDATSRYFSPVDENGSYLPSGVARMGPMVERIGERLFRIAPYARHLDNPVWRARRPGDRIVILARYAEGSSGAPRFLLSAFCGAKNIDVRDSAGQVFTATSCYAPSFVGCRAVGRGDADIVTANADSMLAAGIIGPYVSDCIFTGLEDDGINVGTNTGDLTTIPKDGRYHHPGQDGGPHPHVGLFLADGVDGHIKMFGKIGPDGATTRLLPDDAIPADVFATISAKEARITGYMESQATRTLRPDRVIRIPGTVGAVVRNCEFSRLRGRGVQVHCANMLIESVKVSDVTGCGISVHGLISWGMCFNLHNILVRDCSFTNLGETGARVLPAFLVRGDAPGHRMQFGIEFDRCLFEPGGGHSAAVVGNTADVLFKDCMMVGNFSSGPIKTLESATNVRVEGCTVGKVAAYGEDAFLKCEKAGPVRDGIWNFPEPRSEVKTLRTTACALGLDMSRKGALAWMRSCATGREFAANDGSSLFALSFIKHSASCAETRIITAADATDFSFEAAPREIRLVYSGFSDCAAKVVCTVSARRGDNKIYWDIETEIADGWALVSSDYPVMALKAPPDISSPFACGHCLQSLIFMAAEDTSGAEKTFRATSTNGAYHWAFSRTGLQTGIAKQGYKVVIAVLDGVSGKAPDWRDAAEVFREWPHAGGDDPFKVTANVADGSDSCQEPPLKVVFLGNSINGTPPSKRWDGNWGMTASWPFRDYVAQTVKGLEGLCGRRVDWRRRNLSQWERNLSTWDINEKLADYLAFKPDIVVIALGENVPSLKTEADQALYREKLTELAQLFKDAGANIVIRSPFWRLAHHREICEAVSHEVGAAYADLNGCGSDDPSLLALGSTVDDAVAGHPGDKGMAKIAEVVLKAITDADILSAIP